MSDINMPRDIAEKIHLDFKKEIDINEVHQLLNTAIKKRHFLSKNQMCRILLALGEGNVNKIRDIIESGFYGDDRDMLSIANDKYPDLDYGRAPFSLHAKKPGWTHDYWTNSDSINRQVFKKTSEWLLDTLDKLKEGRPPLGMEKKKLIFSYELIGDTFYTLIMNNSPHAKLPDSITIEAPLKQSLDKLALDSECISFAIHEGNSGALHLGSLGLYELSNKLDSSLVGHGQLYPIYMYLLNRKVGNDFDNCDSLSTGLVGENLDWLLHLSLKKGKGTSMLEITIYGNDVFCSAFDEFSKL